MRPRQAGRCDGVESKTRRRRSPGSGWPAASSRSPGLGPGTFSLRRGRQSEKLAVPTRGEGREASDPRCARALRQLEGRVMLPWPHPAAANPQRNRSQPLRGELGTVTFPLRLGCQSVKLAVPTPGAPEETADPCFARALRQLEGRVMLPWPHPAGANPQRNRSQPLRGELGTVTFPLRLGCQSVKLAVPTRGAPRETAEPRFARVLRQLEGRVMLPWPHSAAANPQRNRSQPLRGELGTVTFPLRLGCQSAKLAVPTRGAPRVTAEPRFARALRQLEGQCLAR